VSYGTSAKNVFIFVLNKQKLGKNVFLFWSLGQTL
jgi:hypothetical protein